MAVSEFNNKKFDEKQKIGKSSSSSINLNKHNKNILKFIFLIII